MPDVCRARFRISVGLAIGVSALVVASCSSGGGRVASRSTTAPEGATTTTTPTTLAATAVRARPSAGCSATTPVAPGKRRIDLTSGGTARWYLREVPRSDAPPRLQLPKPVPVVIDLHGYMVGATLEDTVTGLGAFGDAHGFVTITPQGSGSPKLISWNTASGSADVKFVGDLLDDVERTVCVDENRVFVTGYSQGAFMASTLACALADRIAAVAPIAGIRDAPGCRPARPVPVVAFHGTADPDIAYTGGLGPGGLSLPAYDGSGKTMAQEGLDRRPPLNGASIPAIATAWAARNGCGRVPTTRAVARDVSRLTWPCAPTRTVELYRISGGGHTWPGSAFTAAAASILGPTTMSISANQIMWRFFTAHPLRAS